MYTVSCSILNVWQDICAHDITHCEDREATVGLALGMGSISAAFEMAPQKSVWQPDVQLMETVAGLWEERWHMLLVAWIAALEESIFL